MNDITDVKLLQRAAHLLLDGSGMLRLEAQEWRNRKNSVPRSWDGGMTDWSAKCDRIAKTNEAAADAMSEHAKAIVDAVTAKAQA